MVSLREVEEEKERFGVFNPYPRLSLLFNLKDDRYDAITLLCLVLRPPLLLYDVCIQVSATFMGIYLIHLEPKLREHGFRLRNRLSAI